MANFYKGNKMTSYTQNILQQVKQKHEQMREHLNTSDLQQLFHKDLDPRITYRLCKLYIETFDQECEE